MKVYAILVEPEASRAAIRAIAYLSLASAQADLMKIVPSVIQTDPFHFYDEDYTYYTIFEMEVL